MKKCAHIIIHGLVQGVYFRAYTQKKAIELNIKGWVRNRREGCVEIIAQGDEENLREFIDWCHIGSPHSQVQEVNVRWSECKEAFNNFEVKQTR
jgi:acylphosphatase